MNKFNQYDRMERAHRFRDHIENVIGDVHLRNMGSVYTVHQPRIGVDIQTGQSDDERLVFVAVYRQPGSVYLVEKYYQNALPAGHPEYNPNRANLDPVCHVVARIENVQRSQLRGFMYALTKQQFSPGVGLDTRKATEVIE